MYKNVRYKDKIYQIEIVWDGTNYCLRAVNISEFISIPMDCLFDIEKITPYIIQAIEYKSDIFEIQKWHGIL